MVSKNYPIIGEHVIIFVTQKAPILTVYPAKTSFITALGVWNLNDNQIVICIMRLIFPCGDLTPALLAARSIVSRSLVLHFGFSRKRECSQSSGSMHWLVGITCGNVPVKLKLEHPPGHLTSFPAREGGNLMNLVSPGIGHLITTHRGWGIWSLASISC